MENIRTSNHALVGRLVLHLAGTDPDTLDYLNDEQWETIADEAGLAVPGVSARWDVIVILRSKRYSSTAATETVKVVEKMPALF